MHAQRRSQVRLRAAGLARALARRAQPDPVGGLTPSIVQPPREEDGSLEIGDRLAVVAEAAKAAADLAEQPQLSLRVGRTEAEELAHTSEAYGIDRGIGPHVAGAAVAPGAR